MKVQVMGRAFAFVSFDGEYNNLWKTLHMFFTLQAFAVSAILTFNVSTLEMCVDVAAYNIRIYAILQRI